MTAVCHGRPVEWAEHWRSDAIGNLFIADTNNPANPAGVGQRDHHIVSALAAGFAGDGSPAPAAQLTYPWGIAVDAVNNLFIADTPAAHEFGRCPQGSYHYCRRLWWCWFLVATAVGRGCPVELSDGLAADALATYSSLTATITGFGRSRRTG